MARRLLLAIAALAFASCSAEQPAAPAATVHNILTNGTLVAIVSHVFTNPPDNGREFVEHWDVIRPLGLADAETVGCGFGASYEAASEAGNTIARPACGTIADHWTVDQPIPEFSVSGRSMTGGPDDPLEPGRVKRAPTPGE